MRLVGVLAIALPVLSLACLLIGLLKRGRPPFFVVAAAVLPLIGAVYYAVWEMAHYAMETWLLATVVWTAVAFLALVVGTLAAKRGRKLGRRLVLAGLAMPALPAIPLLLFVLAVVANGGME